MKSNNDGVTQTYRGGVNNRRIRAKQRLEAQLKSGTKTEKVAALTLYTTGANQLPLTENDVKRIEKEITILNNKIK